MKSFKQVLKITIFMTLSYFSAIDAYSQYFTLTQPNGKKFQAREVGYCCYLNFLETPDGYIVVRGPDRYYHYANYHKDKIFTASGLKVGVDSPKSVIRNIKDNQIIIEKIQEEADRYNAAAKENLKRFLEFQGNPANYKPQNNVGIEKAATATNLDMGIILVEFDDLGHYSPPYRKDHFETMAFSTDSYHRDFGAETPDHEEVFGSIRDYYEVQSSGDLIISGEVVNPVIGGELRWIRLGNTSAYPPGSDGNAPTNLVVDAINAVFDSAASSSVWENKHANYEVTMIIVGGEDRDLYDVGVAWLQGRFSAQDFHPDFHFSNWFGATVFHERHGRRRGTLPINFTHIGVWCHELGHLLGTGLLGGIDDHPPVDCQDWTVMRSGMRTGPLRKGASPGNFDAPALVSFDWVTPTIIDDNLLNQPIQYINNKTQQRNFYQFNVDFISNIFIIENRQYEDLNSYLPEYWESTNLGGLLIWKWQSTGSNERIIRPADNDFDYVNPSLGDADDPFPGRTVNNRTITMSTTPHTKIREILSHPPRWRIRATGFAIKNISNSGNTMTADFYNNYWEGEIDYDEVWSANRNPYYVGGNVFVSSGVSLTFGTGTIIDLNGNVIKLINGTLARQDNVTFNPDIQLKQSATLLGQYSTLEQALNDAASGNTIIINSNITVASNVSIPNGVTLICKSGTTIDLNGYNIETDGGTIDRDTSVTFIPDVRLVYVSYNEITGQYSDLQEALNDASSSEQVHVYSDVSTSDNVSVPSNRMLKIMPGNSLKFGYGKGLYVHGEIYAYGQWNNRVVFTSIVPYTQWEGIKFFSDSYQYSYIYHCEISYANYGIYLEHHEPMESYRYNYIHHCNYGIFSRYSAPEIKDSYIQDNYLFGIYVMYGNPAFPNWHIRIAENDIRTTDEYDGIFLWESDAKIWEDNDIFDNQRYGVNAYTYSDVIMVAASSGLNSVHYNHEGQLHFYDHCDGHVGHSGYYNTHGATNRILGNSYRVVAETSSHVYARRVWWGVHWWGWDPPEGLFYNSPGSIIDHNFPLENDPQPSMLASHDLPKNSDPKLVQLSASISTSANSLSPIDRAILYVFEAKFDSATTLCDSIIQVDPGHQDAIHAQSLLWRISRRTKSSDFFTKLSTNEQKYADLEIGAAAQRIKGLLLAGERDYQSAAAQLERVKEQAKYKGTSTHKHVLFDLIDLYHFDLKQDDMAKKYLEELTSLCSKDDEVVMLANLMMDIKTQDFPKPGLNKPTQESVEPEIPREYILHQSYPNPFNSSTTIRFQLPENSLVTLEIYNMMGQKIKTLINGEYKPVGFHQASWDGRDDAGIQISSGIYVYYFRAGKYFDSKKLILMK